MYVLLKHPLVDCDLEEAALWYNRRNPDAAGRLINATQQAMQLAAGEPLRFPRRFGDYRRVKVVGFPYGLYFKVRDDAVRILALIHAARDVESILGTRDPQDE